MMPCFKYLLILFLVLQPVLLVSGARNLDDNPIKEPARHGYDEPTTWPGAPNPITLKYRFLSNLSAVHYLSETDHHSLSETEIKSAFERAFAKWSSVTRVTFQLQEVYGVDSHIKISFYPLLDKNDHLVKTYLPPSGRLRLNVRVKWAVDNLTADAYDLESVAIHAIGHVLGLSHSHSPDSVMYHEISPGIKKLDLSPEDVVRAQHLYGQNPDYHYDSTLQAPAPAPSTSSSSILMKDLAARSLGFIINLVVVAAASLMTVTS